VWYPASTSVSTHINLWCTALIAPPLPPSFPLHPAQLHSFWRFQSALTSPNSICSPEWPPAPGYQLCGFILTLDWLPSLLGHFMVYLALWAILPQSRTPSMSLDSLCKPKWPPGSSPQCDALVSYLGPSWVLRTSPGMSGSLQVYLVSFLHPLASTICVHVLTHSITSSTAS
jgi:hypothetical protein